MPGSNLDKLAAQIEKLRSDLLYDDSDLVPQLGPMSEQNFLLALAALESAQRHMTIAHYNLMRGD